MTIEKARTLWSGYRMYNKHASAHLPITVTVAALVGDLVAVLTGCQFIEGVGLQNPTCGRDYCRVEGVPHWMTLQLFIDTYTESAGWVELTK